MHENWSGYGAIEALCWLYETNMSCVTLIFYMPHINTHGALAMIYTTFDVIFSFREKPPDML